MQQKIIQKVVCPEFLPPHLLLDLDRKHLLCSKVGEKRRVPFPLNITFAIKIETFAIIRGERDSYFKMNGIKTSLITLLWIGVFAFTSSAQESEQSASNKKYVTRMQIIQDLAAQVDSLKVQNSRLNDTLSAYQQAANALRIENTQLQKDVKQMESSLEGAINEKLQSSHTNSVLFIFIFLTGLIVLLALIWLFMKKPATVAHYQDTRTNLEDEDDEDSEKNGVDHQLDRIAKLGSLREKGLLTDDEFNMQKKQILGERH